MGRRGPQFPNFTLTSTRMWNNEFDQATLDVQVERDLRVTVVPAKPVVGPGEPVELDVATVDQLGQPVAAELSIAMVDQSLLQLFGDTLPEIGPFFYNQTRTGAFATESTNTFRYAPTTVAVSQAVVDEADRLAAVARNSSELGRVGNRLSRWRCRIRRPAPDNYRQRAEWVCQEPGAPLQQRLSRESRVRQVRQEVNEAIAFGDNKDKWVERETRTPAITNLECSLFEEGLVEKAGEDCVPRERFVETAYWNPSVVTGKDGKARVTFKAPSALSDYRITAEGDHRRRHVGRPDDRDADRPQELLRRSQAARLAHSRRQAEVRRAGPSRRRRRQAQHSGWRSTPADVTRFIRKRSTSRATESTRYRSSRSRSPRAIRSG